MRIINLTGKHKSKFIVTGTDVYNKRVKIFTNDSLYKYTVYHGTIWKNKTKNTRKKHHIIRKGIIY